MWSLDVEEVLVGAGLLLDLRTPLVVIEADTRAPAVDIAVVRTVAANTAVAGTAAVAARTDFFDCSAAALNRRLRSPAQAPPADCATRRAYPAAARLGC